MASKARHAAREGLHLVVVMKMQGDEVPGSGHYVRGPGCSSRYEANNAWAKGSAYARSLRALCES